jgi:hypothetical protein
MREERGERERKGAEVNVGLKGFNGAE